MHKMTLKTIVAKTVESTTAQRAVLAKSLPPLPRSGMQVEKLWSHRVDEPPDAEIDVPDASDWLEDALSDIVRRV